MDATLRKQTGTHYTPVELADFLARQTAVCLTTPKDEIRILDPACGDGQLLVSLVERLQKIGYRSIHVCGFEIDLGAIEQTQLRLSPFDLASVELVNQDFLTSQDFDSTANGQFDCVIANPPYVRTQVLGGQSAQALAKKFKLSGRVDLYQAFAVAIGIALKPGGAMGLLTSNRFLTVKSGVAMRQLLLSQFKLDQVFDLGDTHLFEAAVLPAIVTGVRRDSELPCPVDADQKTAGHESINQFTEFHRVYRGGDSNFNTEKAQSVFTAIEDKSLCGEVETSAGLLTIERGELLVSENCPWRLTNSDSREWLNQIRSKQVYRFADLAEIKVGIKTTADAVFIRTDWGQVEKATRPEKKNLLPLITHHDAERWTIETPQKKVLYPYQLNKQKRALVDLNKFPKTKAYFDQHRERLEGRKYVIESGRQWFEIWVPHQPIDWAQPKIVWPDISEHPRFFLDSSGAIVNGDCYWIKLRADTDPDWVYMMLAVANSTIATKFYDTMFHNKLYAGRRRFMTQYVKEFPLPELGSKSGQQIVKLTKGLIANPNPRDEAKLEEKVCQAFGF